MDLTKETSRQNVESVSGVFITKHNKVWKKRAEGAYI